jgi:hypothetical protein
MGHLMVHSAPNRRENMDTSKLHYGSRIKLIGKSDKVSEWGTYSTTVVEQISGHDTLEKAIARAIETLKDAQNRWLSNYDSMVDFMIVEG